MNNKLIAAKAFTAQIDTAAEVAGYNGNAAAALARTYLSKADATYASIANVAVDSVTSVATATGTAVVTPVTPVSPVVFTATKDVSNVVTFANAGSTIETFPVGTGFTFTSNGAYAGSVTISSTVTGVEVPTGSTLKIYSLSAMGKTFTGTGTVALTDQVSLAASKLNSIDALTTGVLSTSIVGTVGSAADVKTALMSAGITLSPSILVSVTDLSASVDDLNVIDGRTTGVVDAKVTGTAASLNLLAPASTNNAYTLTVTDVDPVAATVLTSLDAKTTVAVNASAVSTINGTSAEVASVAGAAGITKAVGFNSTLSGAFTVSDINIIGAASPTGSITYTGTNADQVLNFSGVSHALTISGGSGVNVINGGAGADIITGGAGADVLTGGLGNDRFVFNAIFGASSDSNLITGVDSILDLGAGDVIVMNLSNVNLFDASLVNGDPSSILTNRSTDQHLLMIKAVSGNEEVDQAALGNLRLGVGSYSADSANAQVEYHITGTSGSDTIRTGSNNDTINGGAGADVIDGGVGDDTYQYATASESTINNVASAATGFDTVQITSGDIFDFAVDVSAVRTAQYYDGQTPQANGNALLTQLNSCYQYAGPSAGIDAMYISMGNNAKGRFLVIDADNNNQITSSDLIIEIVGTNNNKDIQLGLTGGNVVMHEVDPIWF